VVIVDVIVVFLFIVIDISATKEILYFEICKKNILFLRLLQPERPANGSVAGWCDKSSTNFNTLANKTKKNTSYVCYTKRNPNPRVWQPASIVSTSNEIQHVFAHPIHPHYD